MNQISKNRIVIWCISLVVAGIFLLISSCTKQQNRTTILIKAPEPMVTAFQETFDKLKLDKKYIIEVTDDVTKANFVVQEGLNKEGKLIAYSPIIAISNSDSDYLNNLAEKEIIVESEMASGKKDFDFFKVVQKILSEEGSEFKVYYPSKDSDCWEEFYHFMLFTVNDGYYPTTTEELDKAKQITDKFLNSKNVEPFNNNTIERIKGIPQNSIYFMPWADLVRLYRLSGGLTCSICYPKTIVYHSYYATYDELGKVVYDTLEAKKKTGYGYLRGQGYNTRYSKSVGAVGGTSQRNDFNGVEIPVSETFIYEEAN